MPTIADVIRQTVRDSGLSCYRLSKMTGIEPKSLQRFMRGEQGMLLVNVEILAKALGLELALVEKKPVKAKK